MSCPGFQMLHFGGVQKTGDFLLGDVPFWLDYGIPIIDYSSIE
jgi:hypothetical protein